MKKHYILLATACALIACDPIEEDGSFSPIATNVQEVSDGFYFAQFADAAATTPQKDGNYFTYYTSPAKYVKVYNYNSAGEEVMLALGPSGSFKIAPSRGSNTEQKFYVCVYNSDGEKVVAEKTATVYVKGELTPTERLFCSDSGRKTYKWNDAKVYWGNMCYGAAGSDGQKVYTEQAGKWWGIEGTDSVSERFEEQLKHSVTGQLTGEESLDAYMVFTDDGMIEKYDANGTLLNKTTYEVEEMTENTEWAKYRLKTGENGILWPFEMNACDKTEDGKGRYVKEFEVCYISPTAMTLVYPDNGNYKSFGGWDEATFWQFKADDYEGALAGVDGNGKSWTWNSDTAEVVTVWGNMSYKADAGSKVFTEQAGKWWGIDPLKPEEWEGQIKHTVTGELSGDEDMNAYFTLSPAGELKKYNAKGELLNKTTWEFDASKASGNWSVGHLITGENSVLWPFEMNACDKTDDGKGRYVKDFEVVYVDDDHLVLVYPDEGKFDAGQGSEAAYWQFRAK